MPFIHLWHFSVPTFGLMLWLAAVSAAFIMDRNFRRVHIDADAVGMVAVAVVAGIVGAKLWHVIDTPIEFHEMGWSVLWDSAGFAWFGGLTFGISALVFQGCGWLWSRTHWLLSLRRWLLWASDQIALGHELSAWHRTHPDSCSSHAAL